MNPIIAYFDAVAPTGTAAVHNLAASALCRSLKSGPVAPTLSDAETLKLSEPIAASLAVSNLIGRYRILRIARDSGVYEFNEGEGVPWTPDDLRRLFTPRRALDYFRSIMPIEFSEPLFETLTTGRAFSLAATTSEVIKTKVARVIENRIETGKMIRSAPREIEEILEEAGIPHRAGYGEMVFRTNVMESYRHGGWDQFNSPNVVAYFPVWQYTGIADGRERGANREKAAAHPELPDHHQHFRKFWPREVSFFDVRGHSAADVINCVLPGNYVSGRIHAASKAFYSGDAFEVKMASGCFFTVTGNHPIFAENGLVAASQLQEGFKTWSYNMGEEIGPHSDVQDRPALAEDVFDSFTASLRSKPVSRLDFYGDGEFINGNVDIVLADWHSSAMLHAHQREQVTDIRFKFSLPRSMSRSDLILALGRRHLRPLDSLRFASPSNRHSGFHEPIPNSVAIGAEMFRDGIFGDAFGIHSGNFVNRKMGLRSWGDAYPSSPFMRSLGIHTEPIRDFGDRGARQKHLANPFRYRVPGELSLLNQRADDDIVFQQELFRDVRAYSCLLRNVSDRCSGRVFLDSVESVKRFHYSGPVYDFSADVGYYTASGSIRTAAILKNCRCDFIPIDKREWGRFEKQGKRLEPPP